jgi:hypothetical protein
MPSGGAEAGARPRTDVPALGGTTATTGVDGTAVVASEELNHRVVTLILAPQLGAVIGDQPASCGSVARGRGVGAGVWFGRAAGMPARINRLVRR